MKCTECGVSTAYGNEYESICDDCLNGFRGQVGMRMVGKMEPISGPLRRYIQGLVTRACDAGHPPPLEVMRELGSKGFEVPIKDQVNAACSDVGLVCRHKEEGWAE